MQSSLSANTLFHFTKTSESLLSILSNGIYLNYCREDQSYLWGNEPGTNIFATPMSCFCDIPLSNVSKHMDNYGEYAIGLRKDWAITNRINPVLYLTQDSLTMMSLVNCLITTLPIAEDTQSQSISIDAKNICSSISNELTNIILTSKPYEGRSLETGQNVRFYDEREWRYTPSINDYFKDIPSLLNDTEYADTNIRMMFTEELKRFKLSFSPKDIKYIIVKDDDEILSVMDKIQNINGNWAHNDVKLLTTRIMSSKHILEDF